MSKLDFSGDSKSDTEQQRTNIELENPRHPEASITYAETPEDAAMYFNAAIEAKNFPLPREMVVGELLEGVRRSFNEGDDQYLIELVEDITGGEVTIEYSDEDDE